mgnify:FL=1
MKLIYTKRNIKRKNKNYTVVIPERTGRIVNNREELVDADRKGINAILILALIMMKDPNTIVYFPLKKPLAEIYYYPDYDYFYEEDKKTQADMVFLHRAGQLPISAWKEIRQSLKYTRGVKEVMKVDVDAAYEAGCIARDKYEKTDRYYKRRDLFSFAIEYDTMFFSGGWYAFMDLFIDLKEMLDLPLEDRLDDKAIYGPYYLDDYISFPYDHKNPKVEWPELGFYDRNVLISRKA